MIDLAEINQDPKVEPAVLRRLDIACGDTKPEGWVGIDIAKTPSIDPEKGDIQHNLFEFPWPIEDNSIDEARCSHFFEHVPAKLRPKFMSELWRILKPGAGCLLITPRGYERQVQDISHEWPPVVIGSYFYYARDWLRLNKLDHYIEMYGYNCDFEIRPLECSVTPEFAAKPMEHKGLRNSALSERRRRSSGADREEGETRVRLVDMAQGLINKKAPTVSLPIRDSIDTARGYRMIDELWTCIPDAVYPWDADNLQMIREFAPDTIPLWRLSVFFAPNTRKVVVFGRHALGRHISRPGYDLSPFECSMPTMPCLGISFPRPNKIWFVHEGNRNRDYPDIPGTYLPFDSSIVHRARASVADLPSLSDREVRERLKQEMVLDVVEERSKRKAALQDDWEQREKDFAPYAQKLIDQISDSEMDQWMASIGQRPHQKKQMVHLTGDYPRGE